MVENRQANGSEGAVPRVPFARREGSSFGVEVVDLVELRRRELDHSIFKAHRIDFHILLVGTGGQGWHMVDFVQHPIERGGMIHISPGQIQRYDDQHDISGFLVLFQPEACEIEVPVARWPRVLRLDAADFEVLESLVRTMFDLKTRDLSSSPDRVAWRMLSAILELCATAAERQRALSGKRRESAEFETFDALLEQSFTRHRELSWYARRLGYSERTLSRWCQRTVGINAKTHIDRRVALEAKRILVHTDRSVESIAVGLGFSESTNFVKFFKRLEGSTPSAFRTSYG